MPLETLINLGSIIRRGDELLTELNLPYSFEELLDWHRHGYRPTCRVDVSPKYIELADTYDSAQELLGCSVRAFRG